MNRLELIIRSSFFFLLCLSFPACPPPYMPPTNTPCVNDCIDMLGGPDGPCSDDGAWSFANTSNLGDEVYNTEAEIIEAVCYSEEVTTAKTCSQCWEAITSNSRIADINLACKPGCELNSEIIEYVETRTRRPACLTDTWLFYDETAGHTYLQVCSDFCGDGICSRGEEACRERDPSYCDLDCNPEPSDGICWETYDF